MKMNSMKKVLSFILCIVLIAAVALSITGCNDKETGNDGNTVITMENGKTYGEGANEFTFTVVDAEGKEITATIKTDKTVVGEALVELGLIAGEEGPYGMYIKTVNGTTLDYDKDGMYWSFYIDGEYAMTGVDATEIVAGSTYTIQAEKG